MVSSGKLGKDFTGGIPAYYISRRRCTRLSMGISYRSPANNYLMGMRRI